MTAESITRSAGDAPSAELPRVKSGAFYDSLSKAALSGFKSPVRPAFDQSDTHGLRFTTCPSATLSPPAVSVSVEPDHLVHLSRGHARHGPPALLARRNGTKRKASPVTAAQLQLQSDLHSTSAGCALLLNSPPRRQSRASRSGACSPWPVSAGSRRLCNRGRPPPLRRLSVTSWQLRRMRHLHDTVP